MTINTKQETTTEEQIMNAYRDFFHMYEETPLLVVLDIGTASALKEELNLTELDDLKRYQGMDVAFVMDQDGQTIRFY
tara:strand:- start:764 stop:997 length:234 start_codon:yes stop_codon:yes gene_type:complete